MVSINCRIDKTLMWLLVFFGVFFFVTMPGWICPGDAYVSRAESANIVMNGSYGIDYSLRGQLGDLAVPSVMVLNDAKGKIYSWYGIFNTLAYLPTTCLAWMLSGKVELLDSSPTYTFLINMNNLMFSLIVVYYLYKLTGIYCCHRWMQVLFIVLSVFSTNLWFYLRSQHHELFQIVTFLGFVYYFVLFLRGGESEDVRRQWRYLLLSSIWLSLLLLTKVYYLSVVAVAFAFCLASGDSPGTAIDRVRNNLTRHKLAIVTNMVLPLASAMAVALFFNKIRTGSFLSTGYPSTASDFQSEIAFSLDALAQSIPGLFIDGGNCNLFFNYPVFFFALFGSIAFLWKRNIDTLFIAAVVTTNIFILACFHGWDGGMSYGPRYYLPFLLVGSLPFLELTRYFSEHWREWPSVVLIAATAVVFSASVWSQVCVNSIGNFSCWFIEYKFRQFNDKEIDGYFHSGLTRAYIYRDLVAFRSFHGKFPPLELAKSKYIPISEYIESEKNLNTNFGYDFMVLRLFRPDEVVGPDPVS